MPKRELIKEDGILTTSLTAKRVRELLEYDPETGIFYWKARVNRGVRKGDVAGCVGTRGYIFIKIREKRYAAHRLAWLYMTGDWPALPIDHVNRITNDNRIANLRLATLSQNGANSIGAPRDPAQLKGITFHRKSKKWMAQIVKDGRKHYLGIYAVAEDAHGAYARAAIKLFGEFARATREGGQ